MRARERERHIGSAGVDLKVWEERDEARIRQRESTGGCGREGLTLESSKSCLVSASTSFISPTEPMRSLTAEVWAARAEPRMSLTFYSRDGHTGALASVTSDGFRMGQTRDALGFDRRPTRGKARG